MKTGRVRSAVMVVAAAVLLAGLLLWAWWRWSGQPLGSGPAEYFTIRAGESVASIAKRLQADRQVRSALAFRLRARAERKSPRAGVYEVAPNLGPDALLDRFASGEQAVTRITLPEGFDLKRSAERAERAGICTAVDYFGAARPGSEAARRLGLGPRTSLEGYLFPDTYLVPRPPTAERLVDLQVDQFERVWRELQGDQRLAGRTRAEVVTAASLIEREARGDDERARIAGVIANRLRAGMRLQIDATVLYALGEHKTRILYSDLKVESPYNTYLHKGLPPGPICCPGRASLAAALEPEQNDYLFYVLGKNGRHVFTRTAAQHSAAVAAARN